MSYFTFDNQNFSCGDHFTIWNEKLELEALGLENIWLNVILLLCILCMLSLQSTVTQNLEHLHRKPIFISLLLLSTVFNWEL